MRPSRTACQGSRRPRSGRRAIDCGRCHVTFASRCLGLAVLAAAMFAGCQAGTPSATPPIVAGASGSPREVNLDHQGLLVPARRAGPRARRDHPPARHQRRPRDPRSDPRRHGRQGAWEVAEAATVGAPPGPTPMVSVPPGVEGLRIVVHSGERVDVTWTVPVTDVHVSSSAATSRGTGRRACRSPSGGWIRAPARPRRVPREPRPVTAHGGTLWSRATARSQRPPARC